MREGAPALHLLRLGGPEMGGGGAQSASGESNAWEKFFWALNVFLEGVSVSMP